MNRIDWPALLRLGLVGLGLRPAEFWVLTPAELALMAETLSPRQQMMNRAGLAALMQAHPDTQK